MIMVNGKFDVAWEEGMTVAQLLERLKFTFPLVMVSVDGVMVPRSEFDRYLIPQEATVQVLHMIAGG
jgi:thiamine biosynthesis protein ThiS